MDILFKTEGVYINTHYWVNNFPIKLRLKTTL